MLEVTAALYIVGLGRMCEPEADVTDPAEAEGMVGLLDGELRHLTLDVVVVPRGYLRVGDQHVDHDLRRPRKSRT